MNPKLDIKTCPFCGGVQLRIQEETRFLLPYVTLHITCAGCSVKFLIKAANRYDAVSLWNKRAA